MRSVMAGLLLIGMFCLSAAPPAQADPTGWPVGGEVVREYDPPVEHWQAGHRGLDLAGAPGDVVRASSGGVVTFAGMVAGRPVVVVTHDSRRSTYEPVSPLVAAGDEVASGDPIGTLLAGHDCPRAACLHWGLKRGEDYLDPRSLLMADSIRLLPLGSVAEAVAGVEARSQARTGTLLRPVEAAVGSPFGRRLHPILRVWRLHAGVDLSAPCGTPIRAAADGVVASVGFDTSGGHRLVLDHGLLAGRQLITSYLHATGYRVAVGTAVRRGDVVGWVGSTGLSTGCHLHFSVRVNGEYVDPAGFW